jgi:hypothetical protein
MTKIFFKESQKVDLGWRWIFFIGLYILMCWALIEQLKEESDLASIVAISFSIAIIIIFNVIVIIMQLETIIDKNKITYRYKPFHAKPKEILWNDVEDCYFRYYKPLKEYGGHGIQPGIKFGKSYTVSGNNGLQLVLKNGKKILIGTQKPKELQKVIEKIDLPSFKYFEKR